MELEKKGVRGSRKALIIFLVLGIIGFGYSQYASASQIEAKIVHSELNGETGSQSNYNIQLQFENPSLLYFSSGETEFLITANGKVVGLGELEPFVLPALSTSYAEGTFETFRQVEDTESAPIVKISGVTQYDLIITSIDVPFVFYPTAEQAREFIHHS